MSNSRLRPSPSTGELPETFLNHSEITIKSIAGVLAGRALKIIKQLAPEIPHLFERSPISGAHVNGYNRFDGRSHRSSSKERARLAHNGRSIATNSLKFWCTVY